MSRRYFRYCALSGKGQRMAIKVFKTHFALFAHLKKIMKLIQRF